MGSHGHRLWAMVREGTTWCDPDVFTVLRPSRAVRAFHPAPPKGTLRIYRWHRHATSDGVGVRVVTSGLLLRAMAAGALRRAYGIRVVGQPTVSGDGWVRPIAPLGDKVSDCRPNA